MESQARKETQLKKLREEEKKKEQERILIEKRRKIEFPEGGSQPVTAGNGKNKKKAIRDQFFAVMQRNPHLFKANLIDQKLTILKTQGFFQAPYPVPEKQAKEYTVLSNPALKVAVCHAVQPNGHQLRRGPASNRVHLHEEVLQVHPV